MLKLCSIGQEGLEAAAELLTKGFPARSLAFWQRGLRRLADHNSATGMPSVGNFLMAGETPVGILLTIPKRDAHTGHRVVNLSSWYVEENHRWSAARMLMAVMADKRAVYTDLTPTRAAAEVNARFGFRSFNYKLLVLVLPWLALVGRKQGRLVPLAAIPPGAISDVLMTDLKNHRDLGCIVTSIEVDGSYHPVVLDVTRRKCIPTARVVFADNMDLIVRNLAAIARMLVLRGVPLLTLQVDEDAHIPHTWVWKRGLCYQVKGDWDDRVINELYSERVLLKV